MSMDLSQIIFNARVRSREERDAQTQTPNLWDDVGAAKDEAVRTQKAFIQADRRHALLARVHSVKCSQQRVFCPWHFSADRYLPTASEFEAALRLYDVPVDTVTAHEMRQDEFPFNYTQLVVKLHE